MKLAYGENIISFYKLFNSLRTGYDFCHKGRETEIAPTISKWSKPIDMTMAFIGKLN
jgi:hypothetical protein